MAKPYRTITHYNSRQQLEQQLKDNNIEYTKQDVFDGFWAVQFKIMRPRGKDAMAKCKFIDSL